ncbi:T9SS type A sorting domain-containing protein [Hymenobacter sp. B81]|uniref:T9SS type A sorting domain-containing protein n=1 Tax=Hymenobacter sp. B81 TaxID=3344878 RepID=UPI0037DD619D
MKKILLTLACAFALSTAASAQTPYFVTQGIGAAITPQNHIVSDVEAVDASTAWILFRENIANGTARRFVRTVDGGTTWTGGPLNIPANLSVTNFTAVDGNTAWIAAYSTAGAGGGVFKTTDGGVTWTRQPTAAFTGADAFPNVIHFFDANNGVVMGDPNPRPAGGVGGSLEVYTTTDGGTNWTRVSRAPVTTDAFEYGLVNSYFALGNTIWAGGYNDDDRAVRLYKSTNMGVTWTAAPTDLLAAVNHIAFADQNNGLMANGLDLVKTTDGGATNTAIGYTGEFRDAGMDAVPGLPNTYVVVGSRDFAADSLNDYGASISRDGGVTWDVLDSSKGMFEIDVVSPSVGWAGSFLGATAVNGAVYKLNRSVTLANKPMAAVKADIQVYPNPSANGVFTLRNGAVNNKIGRVVVSDALGRQVYSTNLQDARVAGQEAPIDLSKQKAGVYTMLLQTEKGSVVEKLVIQ